MTYLIAALFILRLFFWRIFPEYGTSFVGDVVFGVISLNAITLYQLAKTKSPLAPFLFLWVLASGISFFRSINPMVSAYSLFTLSVYALVFCGIVKNVRTRKGLRILWSVVIAGAVLSAALGIWEFYVLRSSSTSGTAPDIIKYIFASGRSCSFQGWPTALAGFLILAIPTVFYIDNILTGLCLGLLILGVVSTFSILPALCLGIAFILFKVKENIWWLLLGLGIIIGIAWSTKNLESFLTTRGWYYETAWQMIAQHPILGNGIGTYSHEGRAPSLFVHNSYIQVFSESGALGFFGLCGTAIAFFRMKPGKDMLQMGLYVGVLAVLIDNLFSFTMLKPNLSFVWWVSLALYSNLQQGRVQ